MKEKERCVQNGYAVSLYDVQNISIFKASKYFRL